MLFEDLFELMAKVLYDLKQTHLSIPLNKQYLTTVNIHKNELSFWMLPLESN